MTSPLPVAIVGYGYAASIIHLPIIERTPGLRIAAVVCRSREKQSAARMRLPGAAVVSSLGDAVADPAVELVVVATPTASHYPIVVEALDAGKHVVVDKPFAGTVGEADAILVAAERNQRSVFVFHNRRWDADFLTLQRLVADGQLDGLRRFESRWETLRPIAGRWRDSAVPADFGGVILDIGAHLIDQAVCLCGPVRSVNASARSTRAPSIAVDEAFLWLEHAAGAESTLTISKNAPHPTHRFLAVGHTGSAVFYGFDSQERLLNTEVSSGQLPASPTGVDSYGYFTRVQDSVAGPPQPIRMEAGRWRDFYSGVRDAIRLGEAPPVRPDEALEVMRVLDAANRSASAGRRVSILSAP